MPPANSARRLPNAESLSSVESAESPLTPDHFGIEERSSYSLQFLAREFDVSVKTLQREILCGNLRAVFVGASPRVPKVELRHYLIRRGSQLCGDDLLAGIEVSGTD